MPVAGVAVHRRVLAHRRDDDAVGQVQRADLQGGEEVAHGGFGRGDAGDLARGNAGDGRALGLGRYR